MLGRKSVAIACIIPLIFNIGISSYRIPQSMIANKSGDVDFEIKQDLRIERYTQLLDERVVENQERVRIEEEIKKAEEERLIEEARRIEEEKVITYNPYNILEPSNVTNEQAYDMLEGSALQSMSRAFVYAEEVYGVNLIFLMALTTEESFHGRSTLAITNNNLNGVKTTNGDWAYFNDWNESLDFTANMLKEEYLTEDGLFFNGYSIWNINERYCIGGNWSENINQIANELMHKSK